MDDYNLENIADPSQDGADALNDDTFGDVAAVSDDWQQTHDDLIEQLRKHATQSLGAASDAFNSDTFGDAATAAQFDDRWERHHEMYATSIEDERRRMDPRAPADAPRRGGVGRGAPVVDPFSSMAGVAHANTVPIAVERGVAVQHPLQQYDPFRQPAALGGQSGAPFASNAAPPGAQPLPSRPLSLEEIQQQMKLKRQQERQQQQQQQQQHQQQQRQQQGPQGPALPYGASGAQGPPPQHVEQIMRQQQQQQRQQQPQQQGYAPQGYAPQGYPPPGYLPQGYAPPGYAPPPPHGFAQYPPQFPPPYVQQQQQQQQQHAPPQQPAMAPQYAFQAPPGAYGQQSSAQALHHMPAPPAGHSAASDARPLEPFSAAVASSSAGPGAPLYSQTPQQISSASRASAEATAASVAAAFVGAIGPRKARNNLMTQNEIEEVIRGQLAHIAGGNPFIDDFYYQAMLVQRRGDRKGFHVPVSARNASRLGEKRPTSNSLQNVLGRPAAVSVRTPRPLIQILKDESAHSDRDAEDPVAEAARNESVRAIRAVVEACYASVLDLFDAVRTIKLGCDANTRRDADAIVRAARSRLLALLAVPDFIGESEEGVLAAADTVMARFLSLRKGRALIARALPLLSDDQRASLLHVLSRNAAQLWKTGREDGGLCKAVAEVARDEDENVVMQMLHSMMAAGVDGVAQALFAAPSGLMVGALLQCSGRVSSEMRATWQQLVAPLVAPALGALKQALASGPSALPSDRVSAVLHGCTALAGVCAGAERAAMLDVLSSGVAGWRTAHSAELEQLAGALKQDASADLVEQLAKLAL